MKLHGFARSKYDAQKPEWFRVLSKGLERFREVLSGLEKLGGV